MMFSRGQALRWRSLLATGWVVLATCCLAAPRAEAQTPPSEFNYQGRLTDLAGNPVSGTVSMTFQLYDADAGGSPLWEETQPLVTVDEGIFTVFLGSVEPFDIWGIDFSQQYWLEIEVEGDQMGDRLAIVPVPAAHYALNAGTLDGVPVDELEESQEIVDAVEQHEVDYHVGTGVDAPWAFVHGGHYSYVVCGVRTNGRAECWGSYHLHLPDTYQQVVTGANHVCALKLDGTLACYGDDTYGQATPPGGTYTQLTAGQFHNCAVKTDQSIECWGDDTYGQASPPAGSFVQVDANASGCCAVTTAGAIEYWGNGAPGVLPAGTYTQVTASSGSHCAIRDDGALECSGDPPPAGSFLQVDGAHSHFCGIKDDLSIECWGSDVNYKLMAPPGSFSFLNANHTSTCAIDTNGGMHCWGSNSTGQCSPP